MNVIAKISCYFAQCGYIKTKTARRIFKYSDMQYTSLTPDKILNSLIYRTLFYVNIYGSYKLLKTVRFFGPPCILEYHWEGTNLTPEFWSQSKIWIS